MRIAPITNCKPKINFSSSWGDLPERTPKNNFNSKTNLSNSSTDLKETAIACGGILSGVILLCMSLCGVSPSKEEKNKEFVENTFNIIQSDNIRKDTVVIKDVTGDENPDIVLLKNDGSKVVIDFANQKILEKTKALTPVK